MALLNRTNSSRSRNVYNRNNGISPYENDSSVPVGGRSEIPHAYIDSESQQRNGGKRLKKATSWTFTVGMLMTVVLVSGYSYMSYDERKMMIAQLIEQETVMRELEIDLSMQFDSKVQKMKDENAKLQRKLSEEHAGQKDYNQELKDHTKKLRVQVEQSNEEAKKAKEQNNRLEVQVRERNDKIKTIDTSNVRLDKNRMTLQKNIQKMSRMALVEKFGTRTHKVEMYLRFDSHMGKVDGGYVQIEMAPTDEMPHTVYWFLEQVSRKLYDGTSFHRNPGHVLQEGAVGNFLSDSKSPDSSKKFMDSGFHAVLFQEYSNKMPHKKYTLGYAGRPGGPNFYINTKDNSMAHGPGGQGPQYDSHEADTCFAKIVDGFDVVDRMMKLETKKGALLSNVAIVSIKIMNSK